MRWYVIYDRDPSKRISTGIDVSIPGSEGLAVAWAYQNIGAGPRAGNLRHLTQGMFTEACPYRRRVMQKRKSRPLPDRHWAQLRSRLKTHIWPAFGHMDPEKIRPVDIDDWLLDHEDTRGLAVSEALANKIIACLRQVFDELHYRGHTTSNPARLVSYYDETSRRAPFTVEEIQDLFPEDMDDLRRIWLSLEWATFFYLMATTGVRPGEAAAFRLADWVPGTGAVIHQSVDSETRELKGLKTEHRGAVVKPIVFNERLEMYLTLLSYEHHDHEELLFTVDGNRLIPDVSQKHFKGAAKRAGVPLAGRSQYSLRHTFVTQALKHADEKTVARLAGHRQLRKEYDHRVAADYLEANPELRRIMSQLYSSAPDSAV